MRVTRRILKTATRRKRRPSPRQNGGTIDARLLQDVENLAEVVAATIGRLHEAGRTELARPLERALARLGGTR